MPARLRVRGRLRAAAAAWAPVFAWATLIFVLSAQPDLRFVPDAAFDFVIRKVGHMGIFGTLALLVWRAAAINGWRRSWVWAIVLSIAFAATDELHQGLVPGREAALSDLAIDMLGVLLSVAGGLVLLQARKRDPSSCR